MAVRFLYPTSTDKILILSKSEKLGTCVETYEPQMERHSEGICSTKNLYQKKVSNQSSKCLIQEATERRLKQAQSNYNEEVNDKDTTDELQWEVSKARKVLNI